MKFKETGMYECLDCVSHVDIAIVERAIQRVAFFDDESDEKEVCGLLELDKGQWAVFSQWEDYTGHG